LRSFRYESAELRSRAHRDYDRIKGLGRYRKAKASRGFFGASYLQSADRLGEERKRLRLYRSACVTRLCGKALGLPLVTYDRAE
jgi:hypothetical protein